MNTDLLDTHFPDTTLTEFIPPLAPSHIHCVSVSCVGDRIFKNLIDGDSFWTIISNLLRENCQLERIPFTRLTPQDPAWTEDKLLKQEAFIYLPGRYVVPYVQALRILIVEACNSGLFPHSAKPANLLELQFRITSDQREEYR